MGIVKLMAIVATVTTVTSYLILSYVDLYVVIGMALLSILIAGLVGYLMRGHQNTIYGIFKQEVEDGPAFIIAKMKPTEEVTQEDRSFMLENVIAQGGVPIDNIGMWFFRKGMVRLGLMFVVKPGKISDEYRAERAAEEEEPKKSLKSSMDEFKKRNK